MHVCVVCEDIVVVSMWGVIRMWVCVCMACRGIRGFECGGVLKGYGCVCVCVVCGGVGV